MLLYPLSAYQVRGKFSGAEDFLPAVFSCDASMGWTVWKDPSNGVEVGGLLFLLIVFCTSCAFTERSGKCQMLASSSVFKIIDLCPAQFERDRYHASNMRIRWRVR